MMWSKMKGWTWKHGNHALDTCHHFNQLLFFSHDDMDHTRHVAAEQWCLFHKVVGQWKSGEAMPTSPQVTGQDLWRMHFFLQPHSTRLDRSEMFRYHFWETTVTLCRAFFWRAQHVYSICMSISKYINIGFSVDVCNNKPNVRIRKAFPTFTWRLNLFDRVVTRSITVIATLSFCNERSRFEKQIPTSFAIW